MSKKHPKFKKIKHGKLIAIGIFIPFALMAYFLGYSIMSGKTVPMIMLAVFMGLYSRWLYTAFKTGTMQRAWKS